MCYGRTQHLLKETGKYFSMDKAKLIQPIANDKLIRVEVKVQILKIISSFSELAIRESNKSRRKLPFSVDAILYIILLSFPLSYIILPSIHLLFTCFLLFLPSLRKFCKHVFIKYTVISLFLPYSILRLFQIGIGFLYQLLQQLNSTRNTDNSFFKFLY